MEVIVQVCVGILFASTIFLALCVADINYRLNRTSEELTEGHEKERTLRLKLNIINADINADVERRLIYLEKLPEIEEYANLIKAVEYFRGGDMVEFKLNNGREFVRLDNISQKLEETKQLIEKHCPANCKKTTKKRS